MAGRTLVPLLAGICTVSLFATTMAAFAARALWAAEKRGILSPGPAPAASVERLRRADLLVLGDSRAAAWPPAALRGRSVAVAGYPGDSAARIASRAPVVLAETGAREVLIVAGINDLVAASTLPRSARERARHGAFVAIVAMARAARRQGATPILLTIAPPIRPDPLRRFLWGKGLERDVERLNDALRRYASTENVRLIDADRLVRLPDDRPDPAMRRDALHWSDAAYRRLSAAVTDSGR